MQSFGCVCVCACSVDKIHTRTFDADRAYMAKVVGESLRSREESAALTKQSIYMVNMKTAGDLWRMRLN